MLNINIISSNTFIAHCLVRNLVQWYPSDATNSDHSKFISEMSNAEYSHNVIKHFHYTHFTHSPQIVTEVSGERQMSLSSANLGFTQIVTKVSGERTLTAIPGGKHQMPLSSANSGFIHFHKIVTEVSGERTPRALPRGKYHLTEVEKTLD